MAKGKERLSATFVDKAKSNGRLMRYADGAGLYLIVRKSGTKSWSFIWIRGGIRKEMGLGSVDGAIKVTLAQAREKANVIREQLGADLDPFTERDREAPKTFGEVADGVIEKMRKGWTKPKHGANWVRGLEVKCKPIRNIRIDQITTQHVLSVVRPVIEKTTETGMRLRGMIERVIDTATAHGWRKGDNPARWDGHLKILLEDVQRKPKGHFAAMPYDDIPEFVERLHKVDTMAARALEFTLLTAARTSEALEARWSEIDLEARLWTLPAHRMKMKRQHIVPLSNQAVDLLTPLYELRTSEYVFSGQKPNRPLSNMAMAMVLRRMEIKNATVHGTVRSGFKDWALDKTNFEDYVSEAALAHVISDKTKAAYRRQTSLDKRTILMQAWADYCYNIPASQVVRLHG